MANHERLKAEIGHHRHSKRDGRDHAGDAEHLGHQQPRQNDAADGSKQIVENDEGDNDVRILACDPRQPPKQDPAVDGLVRPPGQPPFYHRDPSRSVAL